MRSRYTSQTGNEALFDEADTDFYPRNAAGDSTEGQEAGATGSEAGGHTGTNPALLNDSPGRCFYKRYNDNCYC